MYKHNIQTKYRVCIQITIHTNKLILIIIFVTPAGRSNTLNATNVLQVWCLLNTHCTVDTYYYLRQGARGNLRVRGGYHRVFAIQTSIILKYIRPMVSTVSTGT